MPRPTAEPRLCWDFHDLRTQWGPIRLEQHRADSFRVTYGRSVKDRLPYSEACSELGRAIMHFLSCEGQVNNQTRAEARRDNYHDYSPPTPHAHLACVAMIRPDSVEVEGADALQVAIDHARRHLGLPV